MTKKITIFTLALILVFSISTTVFADAHLPECSDEEVSSGTVVSFNSETGKYTIFYSLEGENPEEDPVEGLCLTTLVINEEDYDYGHPITTLLGNYFAEVNSDTLVDSTKVCVEDDNLDGVWELVEPAENEECPMINVSGYNPEDDTFELEGGGTIDAASLLGVLSSVEWGEGGVVNDAGQTIGDLHADGVGFGVIVKIYGIYQQGCEAKDSENGGDPVDCSVEGLMAQFEEGGMGQLLKTYKTEFKGVGHVRKAANAESSALSASSGESNCNPNANEHSKVACVVDEGGSLEADANNGNNGKGNGNKNKKNKNK